MEINSTKTSSQTINQNSNFNKNIFFINTIKKEIKKEIKILIWIILISAIFLIITIVFLGIGIGIWNEKIDKKWLPSNIFFHWFIQLLLTLILLWILTWSSLSLYKIKQEEKIYYSNENFIDFERTPIFIKNSYKRKIAAKIFLNWFSIISYIFASFFLILLIFFLETKEINFFNLANIKIKIDEANENTIKISIIITSIYLAIVFVLHLFLYILLTKKNTKLSLIFDLENKLDNKEISKFKKKINIICGFIFLSPIIIIIILIWFFKKRKQ